MDTESVNPWDDDDYTAPGEAMLRSYCEEEPEPAETWGAAELAWFASGVRSGVRL